MAGPLYQGKKTLAQIQLAVAASAENQRQAADRTAPEVTDAASTSSSAVVVTFSESMGVSALNPAHYRVTLLGISLAVLSVESVAADSRAVRLETVEQQGGTYSLTVDGATDRAGNSVVLVARPFAGTASTLDADGDGLTDAVESGGYDVTVVPLGGVAVTHRVTSSAWVRTRWWTTSG